MDLVRRTLIVLGIVAVACGSFLLSGVLMLAFLLIQQVENNVVFPLAESEVLSVPPALGLFAVVAAGVLFRPIGLLFGFPLTVVLFVLVKKLYVRETLGEETTVPGEDA